MHHDFERVSFSRHAPPRDVKLRFPPSSGFLLGSFQASTSGTAVGLALFRWLVVADDYQIMRQTACQHPGVPGWA